MGGILQKFFSGLSRSRLSGSCASKEIRETLECEMEESGVSKIPDTVVGLSAPATIPSEKKQRLVSRNIDVPKPPKADRRVNYDTKIRDSTLLYYMEHTAMKKKNKSRRRAYRSEGLGTLDWNRPTHVCEKQRNSDSPDLIFPMD
ncbi:uncharacterized protein LOC125770529 [Anopheles funestus]|uniref:uncharacterized protein LOC125770529 n=1 Tax=Anopheles funestus TaxID=62324 RepID=UPI0020C5DE82|nr:uncharacterized protein LOC125770529 [Anopheles funestus]